MLVRDGRVGGLSRGLPGGTDPDGLGPAPHSAPDPSGAGSDGLSVLGLGRLPERCTDGRPVLYMWSHPSPHNLGVVGSNPPDGHFLCTRETNGSGPADFLGSVVLNASRT